MRWGKPTKNKKRRDPRYFLNEKTSLENWDTGVFDYTVGEDIERAGLTKNLRAVTVEKAPSWLAKKLDAFFNPQRGEVGGRSVKWLPRIIVFNMSSDMGDFPSIDMAEKFKKKLNFTDGAEFFYDVKTFYPPESSSLPRGKGYIYIYPARQR